MCGQGFNHVLPTLEETRRILFGDESASMEASAGAKENKDYHGQQERLNALLKQDDENEDEDDNDAEDEAEKEEKEEEEGEGENPQQIQEPVACEQQPISPQPSLDADTQSRVLSVRLLASLVLSTMFFR